MCDSGRDEYRICLDQCLALAKHKFKGGHGMLNIVCGDNLLKNPKPKPLLLVSHARLICFNGIEIKFDQNRVSRKSVSVRLTDRQLSINHKSLTMQFLFAIVDCAVSETIAFKPDCYFNETVALLLLLLLLLLTTTLGGCKYVRPSKTTTALYSVVSGGQRFPKKPSLSVQYTESFSESTFDLIYYWSATKDGEGIMTCNYNWRTWITTERVVGEELDLWWMSVRNELVLFLPLILVFLIIYNDTVIVGTKKLLIFSPTHWLTWGEKGNH